MPIVWTLSVSLMHSHQVNGIFPTEAAVMCDSISLTGSSSLTFGEFLKQKQLTPNLVQYILYSIAMVTENTPTLEVHVRQYSWFRRSLCNVHFEKRDYRL